MVKSGLSTNAASKLLPSRLLKPLTRGVRPLVASSMICPSVSILPPLLRNRVKLQSTSAHLATLSKNRMRLFLHLGQVHCSPKERH